jgi:hypothetical protein
VGGGQLKINQRYFCHFLKYKVACDFNVWMKFWTL